MPSKKLKQRIKKYLVDRGWDTLRLSDIAKSISIESAELLELFQWENLPLDAVRKQRAKIAEIEHELADVLIYCIEMGILLHIDLEKALHSKLSIIEKKFPAAKMRKSAKEGVGSGQDAEYWHIKRRYRARKGR